MRVLVFSICCMGRVLGHSIGLVRRALGFPAKIIVKSSWEWWKKARLNRDFLGIALDFTHAEKIN